MLTEKEKDELDKLRRGFNVNQESTDYNLMSSKRLEPARRWSKKLLTISFIINCISISLLLISIVISIMKPKPNFFASTPSGRVIYLEKLN